MEKAATILPACPRRDLLKGADKLCVKAAGKEGSLTAAPFVVKAGSRTANLASPQTRFQVYVRRADAAAFPACLQRRNS